MSVLPRHTRHPPTGALREGKVFGHHNTTTTTDAELPVWDDSLQQRLLYELCDGGKTTAGGFGPAGLAALEQKATEIHRTATGGAPDGALIADIDQTTWDAAETLAWLCRDEVGSM